MASTRWSATPRSIAKKLFSGGIRLRYRSFTTQIADLKDGILLEAGFDVVAPNTAKEVSSWMYDQRLIK